MTDPASPTEPDWVRQAKPSDLDDLQGDPYMLRASSDPSSPWRNVKTRTQSFDGDGERVTVEFHEGGPERVLAADEEIEVGLIRPPWWTEDMEPREWPKRD